MAELPEAGLAPARELLEAGTLGAAQALCEEVLRSWPNDIAALVESGLSEDQIFELTVVTAVGAALGRFEKTLELLDEATA